MSNRIDPHASIWELVETMLLILLGIVAVCGLAGFLFARYGADIERAAWAVANIAWALAGWLS